MAVREVEFDAIGDAIVATEKEIAGAAWGQEDTDAADPTGDRSLEDMGDGLEGQQEPEDDDQTVGEDADGEEESDGEGEGATAEDEAAAAAAAAANTAKDGKPDQPDGRTEPGGRVPSSKYREVSERARAAEAERDALKAQIEKSKGDTTSLSERLDLLTREITSLKSAPRNEAQRPAEPPKPVEAPDLFENPKGFVDHITGIFQTELSKRDQQLANARVETSMAIAHGFHKETFEKAFEAINKLNPQNPDDRVVVQRIYSSPNPGEALVNWHKRNETFARVGDDPAKFEERIREETRQALLNDPEFRKKIVAEMRGEAAQPGPDGRPRTTTRLPGSLARAGGSNLGAERSDPRGADESDQAVADAAWR